MDIPKGVYWKVITLYSLYILKVPIGWKDVYWPKMCLLNENVSIDKKMCLLNKNVLIDWKITYWMKMYLLKGYNLLSINNGLYSFDNFFSTSSFSFFLEIRETYGFSLKLPFVKPNKFGCILGTNL